MNNAINDFEINGVLQHFSYSMDKDKIFIQEHMKFPFNARYDVIYWLSMLCI